MKEKDKEIRAQYLYRLAEKYAEDNNISKATAFQELLQHEEIREIFRTIHTKLRMEQTPPLSEVWLGNLIT